MPDRIDELKNTYQLLSTLFQLLKPPPDIKVWEWAEQKRVLSLEETSAPGPWENERTPYLVEIMDDMTNPDIHEIVFLAARQMGKSTLFLNYLGFLIDVSPRPVIVVQPTGDLAEKFSQMRVANMFRDTPCLKQLVPDDKSRDSSNKILYKEGNGWFLILTGANSTAGIISMPIPVIYFDEIDQYPKDLSRQGDVISIAKKMQTNFPNWLSVYTSTPTIENASRIQDLLDKSQNKRYSHECPSCGKWSQFGLRGEESPDENKRVWQTKLDFETLKMICPHCLKAYTKEEWLAGGGKYIAQNPDSKIAGYHVNVFDHPTRTWEDVRDEFIEANDAAKRGDYSLLITFVNSCLAETWQERGEVIESHAFENRREVYNAQLPDGVCVLTMGLDVQDNRFAYEVIGWGVGYESWGIEYGEIFGDTRLPDPWNRIDDLLTRTWSYGNGKRIRISRVAVDTGGHSTTQAYNYCRARQSRGVYPIKGQGGNKIPLTRPSKTAKEKGLFILGVDSIKTEIMTWLKVNMPGNGYCHFPKDTDNVSVNGYDAVYFDMLTAEKRVLVKDKKGFSHYEWHLIKGKRNESFDCRVYARAALRIMSPKDDVMLKRINSAEPWLTKSQDEGKEKIENIEIPTGKKKPRVNRNQIARDNGINL